MKDGVPKLKTKDDKRKIKAVTFADKVIVVYINSNQTRSRPTKKIAPDDKTPTKKRNNN